MWKTMFWPALVTIISLSILAIWFHHNSVEFELRQDAIAELNDDHIWADIRLSGRDLLLYGVSPSAAAQQDARDRLSKLKGVRVVVDQSTLLPVAEPFTTQIEFNAGEIRIIGSLPSQKDRTQIIDILTQKLPAVLILDETKMARGAPNEFGRMIEEALSEVISYPNWRIEIIDGQIKTLIPNNES